jgi:hypothetical protein
MVTALCPSIAHADDEAPAQVLVIPLTGELDGDLADAPESFTELVANALAERGSDVVTAKAQGSDISGIAGCSAESSDCFREVAETIGVQAVVFGSVRTDDDGKTIVTLTHVGLETDLRSRDFDVESTTTDDASEELRPKIDDFLANRPVETDEPVEPPPVVEPEPAPESPGFDFGRVKTHSWATLGGGAAAMVLGAIFYSVASSKQSEVDEAPTETGEDIQRLMDLESSGKRYTTLGNVFMIGGGIAAVVGGVLVVMQARSKPTERPTAIGVAPTAAGDGMTIVFGGTF